MIEASIGVMAYNEEQNIARCLEAILSQELNKAQIKEIFVVASGCTDKTIPIVKRLAKTDKRIKLLIQKERLGKSSAVNLFLKHAKGKIVVCAGADTIPQEDVIEKLARPFSNPRIGMTGARPIPSDPQDHFFGFAAHLLWELHHQVALMSPKMGEMVAYRKIFERIPYASAVDEATVEPLIVGQGYTLKYVPDAIVLNKGTENLFEFMKQRRRIYSGHLALKKIQGYQVSTLGLRKTLLAWVKVLKPDFKYLIWSPAVALLEMMARILGTYDYHFQKNKHTIWDRVESTKNLNVV
ncbi:MAG: glycosyltransferase [Patescibacteria group bacterium]|nr:glycosyltransferase [Patescibacteria group bacterium]MCL5095686.1 glycosyltransferase [Patescibacteria group bacterium]